MPLDELHQEVASIALGAAAEHGFALGGGNALIAHGIIDRRPPDRCQVLPGKITVKGLPEGTRP